MGTSTNTQRIIYATQAVGIGSGGLAITDGASIPAEGKTFSWLHGVQTVGLNTTFNSEQLFELGQLQVYQYVDELPNIEVSIERVIDSWKLAYLQAVGQAGTGNVLEAGKSKTDAVFLIYDDTFTAASGASPLSVVHCKNMFVSNVSYTLGVDGNFSESLTLSGFDRKWYSSSSTINTPFQSIESSSPDLPYGGSGGKQVLRRNHYIPASSRIPSSVSGRLRGGTGNLQTITISADFGREDNLELGRFDPYTRFLTVPLESTCEFAVHSLSGNWVDASGSAPRSADSSQFKEQIIIHIASDGSGGGASGWARFDLGSGCRLTSVNYGGGDATGGNATDTYSYSSFNYFRVSDAWSAADQYHTYKYST
jgi:hypothetical protein